MKLRQWLVLIPALCLSALPAQAQQASTASSALSAGVSEATGSIVAGTISTLAVAGSLTVMAIEKIGESVVLVLKEASTGADVSVRVSGKALGNVSLATGAVITVVASGAGYALYSLGRMIAFIPNEVGRSLVHHNRLDKGTAPQ